MKFNSMSKKMDFYLFFYKKINVLFLFWLTYFVWVRLCGNNIKQK
ncbi:hypothetical protein BN1221_01574 [Brenneria goodwinii]|uniref:Uncharacterized protein n=1 Tax=Brenneria goodwinii TaxID=1109412 RepID=A0A0G4JTX5_9GAMM|nr:hypothetical protein BN1221_01574 [Brenneria goodwinii]